MKAHSVTWKYADKSRCLRKKVRVAHSGIKKKNILLVEIPLQLVDQEADGETWVPGLSGIDECMQVVLTHHISELFSFQYKEYVRDINFLQYKLRHDQKTEIMTSNDVQIVSHKDPKSCSSTEQSASIKLRVYTHPGLIDH